MRNLKILSSRTLSLGMVALSALALAGCGGGGSGPAETAYVARDVESLYIAAKAFTEGLRRAGKDLTREKLVTALESMRSVDLGGFIVNFTPDNHVGSRFVEMTVINSKGQVIR